MQLKRIIDVRELVRFVSSGLTAAAANVGSVWLVRPFWPFSISLLVGIATGFSVSFILSKWLAFRSCSWSRTTAELRRFVTVYALGSLVYWVVAILTRQVLRSSGISGQLADLGGILCGGGIMAFTSYLGHRFFTYREVTLGESKRVIPASEEAKMEAWSELE